MDEQRRRLISRIVDNGMIAALYFALTFLSAIMLLIRNRGFMSVLNPTRHQEVRW